SFLKIGDRAAGAIKSGGTTRRAAKMVILDVDHPDVEQFVDWKVIEEQKVANLVTGSKVNQKHLRAILKACVNCEGSGDDCFDPEKNPVLRREIKAARRNSVPDSYIRRVIQFAKQGATDIQFPIYDTDWDSEAYLTVSGQNSNNTVRVTDEFLKAVEAYEHAFRLWAVVLEIAVLMAQFPSREIAELSYEFRTLGLGYANVGGLLMSSGIPYDSDAGRQLTGTLTAILTGVSYATSAEMAKELGPFPGYKKNREHMLRVIRNHRRAAYGERAGYEKVATPPVPLDHKACPQQKLIAHAKAAWD